MISRFSRYSCQPTFCRGWENSIIIDLWGKNRPGFGVRLFPQSGSSYRRKYNIVMASFSRNDYITDSLQSFNEFSVRSHLRLSLQRFQSSRMCVSLVGIVGAPELVQYFRIIAAGTCVVVVLENKTVPNQAESRWKCALLKYSMICLFLHNTFYPNQLSHNLEPY